MIHQTQMLLIENGRYGPHSSTKSIYDQKERLKTLGYISEKQLYRRYASTAKEKLNRTNRKTTDDKKKKFERKMSLISRQKIIRDKKWK